MVVCLMGQNMSSIAYAAEGDVVEETVIQEAPASTESSGGSDSGSSSGSDSGSSSSSDSGSSSSSDAGTPGSSDSGSTDVAAEPSNPWPSQSTTVEILPGTSEQNFPTVEPGTTEGTETTPGTETGTTEGAEIVPGTETDTTEGTEIVPGTETATTEGTEIVPGTEPGTAEGTEIVPGTETGTTEGTETVPGTEPGTTESTETSVTDGTTEGTETDTAPSTTEGTQTSADTTSGQTAQASNTVPTTVKQVNNGVVTDKVAEKSDDADADKKTDEKSDEKEESGETEESGKVEESGKTEESDKDTADEEETRDYSWVYNEETGHFQVTFNITEGAEGDQTIELSKVLEEVNLYGAQKVEEYLATDEGKAKYDNYLYYGMRFTYTLDNGLKFIYNPRTGEATYYEEPGCTSIFDVSLANGSRHTYTYKNESLIVSTPDVSNDDSTGVIAFDGQELPDAYANSYVSFQYSKDASVTGCIETIVDEALKNSKSGRYYHIDANGNRTNSTKKVTIPKGTRLYEVNGTYYAMTEDGYYYAQFNANQTQIVDGVRVSKSTLSKDTLLKKLENGKLVSVPIPYQRGSSSSVLRPSDYAVETYVLAYLRSKLDDTTTSTGVALANEIVSYYNAKDGTSYKTLGELLEQNETAAKELDEVRNPGNLGVTATVSSSARYDKFYNSILSFNVGSVEGMEEFLSDGDESTAHGHEHGNWVSKGDESLTIGQYMADKLSETDGAWDKANNYFNTLLAAGISSDQATWVAFTMATNIDGENAGNDYQNTLWSWYASVVLEQADGTFELIKTDEDGNVIGDDEGEDQTSFWIWKYEQETAEDGTSKDVPMYCTYVEPVYETVKNENGEEVQQLVTDGYFTWVKYDPEKDALDFTVTTTNGTLLIDYAMLQHIVYYLQEAVAPEGYEIDKHIYIICDPETYEQMKNEDGVVIATNPATGEESAAVYIGAIKGGEKLTVYFVNPTAATPDPDPEPTPTPNPTPDPGSEGGTDPDPTPLTVEELGSVSTPEPITIEESGSVSTSEPISLVEYGSVQTGSNVIQTGDSSNMTLYGAIMAICLALLAGYALEMRRKNNL